MDNFPSINYIGNKEKLVHWIGDNLPIESGTILDLFSGGSSTSYFFKKKGFNVISNDVLYSSYVINKALIENNNITLDPKHIDKATNINNQNSFTSDLSWLSNNLFFDFEVKELTQLVEYSNNLEGYNKYLFLTLLRRAIIRKLPYSRMNVGWDNIVKLRDEDYSYKKYGRRRAYHNKSFTYHMKHELDDYNNAVFNNGTQCIAIQKDMYDALSDIDFVDLIYMDPPYPGTMNKYKNFYGPFDDIFNKSIPFVDLTNKDNFLTEFSNLLKIASLKCNYILVSLNTNIKPHYTSIIKLLEIYGSVDITYKKHNYQLTGKNTKSSSKELLLTLSLV